MIEIKETQVIKDLNWKIESVQILTLTTEERHSKVTYLLTDVNGSIVDKIDLEYRGEKYNEWYANFNEMKFLELELASHINVDTSVVNTDDNEYLNTIIISKE